MKNLSNITINREQAIKLFLIATNHDYPKQWDNLVEGFYDEKNDALPTIYDALRPLGLSKSLIDDIAHTNMNDLKNPYDEIQWGVLIIGIDNVLAAKSFEEAVEKAAEINQTIAKHIKPASITCNCPVIFAHVNRWDSIANFDHNPDETIWGNAEEQKKGTKKGKKKE